MCETAVGATAHLKTLAMNEREARIRLQEENQSLKASLHLGQLHRVVSDFVLFCFFFFFSFLSLCVCVCVI